MPTDEFELAEEKELTGTDSEAAESVYFEVHQRQIKVIEQAVKTAAWMLGLDKARPARCLAMICADFLAGSPRERSNAGGPLQSISNIRLADRRLIRAANLLKQLHRR